jgi:uncharacterized membrane protein SpoIIM required for sporulation
VIINVERFVAAERPHWDELERVLGAFDRDSAKSMALDEARRFHYLYQRASSALAKVGPAAADRELHAYLERLVSRAYAEIHETRRRSVGATSRTWLLRTLPQTFRRFRLAFYASVGITVIGAAFGAGAILADPGAKRVLLPFPHLQGDPSERVAWEENSADEMREGEATFSGMLMSNNIRVSINAMALGMTFGIGTVVLLFYNGVILGAVAADYIRAGETTFLLGWLLPHGAVEIPAILVAGQAGLVLGAALIGWGTPRTLRARLREVRTPLVTLIFGAAIMLVWAGIIESFVSQYHRPVLIYAIKISFGLLELAALYLYFFRVGRKTEFAQSD